MIIEAPSQKESIEILLKSKKYYEDYHNVTYTDEAIEKAVELAERYITDRSLLILLLMLSTWQVLLHQ